VGRAEADIRVGRLPRWEDGPLSFPFITTLSNVRFRGLGLPARLSSELMLTPDTLTPGLPDHRFTSVISGAWEPFMANDQYGMKARKGLMQVNRQIKRVDQDEKPSARTTADRLAWIMREAARHPKYGQLIGRDFLSVVIHPKSSVMPMMYHPEKGSPEGRVPHLLTPWYVISAGGMQLGSRVPPEIEG
jgi:hypothetical protein